MAVTGEASQGFDPGPPHVTAQEQGGKRWNLHMGLQPYEARSLRKVGIIFPTAQTLVIPYHRSQNQMTSVIDLSERKKAEEELRESEDHYRAVVEQAAESLVLFDVDSKRVLEVTSPARPCSVTSPK